MLHFGGRFDRQLEQLSQEFTFRDLADGSAAEYQHVNVAHFHAAGLWVHVKVGTFLGGRHEIKDLAELLI